MLKQIAIKNLAIINDVTIEFEDNLNVLTGETGAGKSIIIDAISLIFGARASSEIIAYGKDSAMVSALIYLNSHLQSKISEILQIDVAEELIIQRVLSINGRNTCKVNGINISLNSLNEISQYIVDISGQNNAQYLLNEKYHLILLDQFIEKEVLDFKKEYILKYKEYQNCVKEIDTLKSEYEKNVDLDYLNFKYQELKDFNYSIDDIDGLMNRHKELQALQVNANILSEIISYFDNDANGVSTNFYSAIKALGKIASSNVLNNYYEKFNSLYLDLEDLIESFKTTFNFEDFDENEYDNIENEITKINRLKRKYNVNDLLAYKNDLKNQIEQISNKEIILSKLEKRKNVLKQEAIDEAKKITQIRKKYSLQLAKDVSEQFNDLYLTSAIFEVKFNEVDLNLNGCDQVEFYMSANKGNPLKPLAKVASGGEVSRIMLGLKTVFTKLSEIDIIIFDEIDTGVSGKVAMAMGKKMEMISKYSQVLAITHLPQVAAMSDHHFYISKLFDGKITKTLVKSLNADEKVEEVARLLSGDSITNSFILAAKELINSK